MITRILIIFLFITTYSLYSQVLPGEPVVGYPKGTTAQITSITTTESVIAYSTDEKIFYYYDGTKWVKLFSENSKVIVDNELFFEDANYYYVSVRINSTDWMVSRFSRTNLNDEAFAMGSGTQPADQATVIGLTYS
ncbi:hypothetical protein [Tenacibaculum jejuense]|uniref:Uncharacterized protein n=1 Tax=Tenacibaculum jejuense TaxID=584609 RepID=A0A238U9Y2_9FLAO|nr:hypothetical protein [Tenacibaculum jejuense]SNR15358.1 protein of unknown function [Tenacibaculum jejuense]